MSQKSLNEKTLSLSKLEYKIDDFSKEILELVNADSKGELYVKFVKKFLKYIPVDYRSNAKIKLFGNFTQEAFDFFKQRTINEKKVEIISNNIQNNPSITILIAAENSPFIIDSLNSLLSILGLKTDFIFHPVLKILRDENGELQDVINTGKNGSHESLVYIKISGVFDPQEQITLKNKIYKVVELVDSTSKSWQPLLTEIINITNNIKENQEIYNKAGFDDHEAIEFLKWLQQNNITFLSAINYELSGNKFIKEVGVKEIWEDKEEEIKTIIEHSESSHYTNKLVMLGKINKISPVHRNVLLDYILIKKLDKKGNYIGGTVILGLYGTAIYFQSIKSIPILRHKLDYVIKESTFQINGYNAKKLKNIIDSLPRDTLIQIDEEDLYCMCIHMLSTMRSQKLKLFIQRDWSDSFLNVIIFIPRNRLTPDVYHDISNYLGENLSGKVISDSITVVSQDYSLLVITLSVNDKKKLQFSQEIIEAELVKITTNWSDNLLNEFTKELGEYKGSIKHKSIKHCFSQEYKHRYDAKTTLEDIKHLTIATEKDKTILNFQKDLNSDGFLLKFYSPKIQLTLSDTLPYIENLGFTAINEHSFSINKSEFFTDSWIYEYKLSSPIDITMAFSTLKLNIEEAIEKMHTGDLASDSLSKLIVLAELDWTKIKLLKALTRYLHQTGFPYGKGYVQLTLIKHSEYTKLLVKLFEMRFCPKNNSIPKSEEIINELDEYLEKKVDSNSEDKVLSYMKKLILAILRTNFYQTINGESKDYLSFKFLSKNVPDLPLPVPYAEIFVYSNDFEGVHARGGKVARGGLRWSDRGEDYRQEVLGLMKAQMAKNAVIVPVGSKGTFFVNLEQKNQSSDEYIKKIVVCYQNYLRGLLDLTDNLVNGETIHPDNTIIHDEEDSYLVVAADKGTATFSDYANAVSKEYNFWLDDAFASGGSVGYDHKEVAITAKGAWISVQQHFLYMGIDIQKDPFTTIGIGDMSGDVFGNGMLLSKCMKLVAAFNHQHIFIDPNPNEEKSYQERMRLFKLSRSKWTDYNQTLLSKGGGIFDRSAKVINLSQEIKSLLDIEEDDISPDKLIKAILQANVDLMWNGGIGTYVKSKSENNIDIGDKANDVLRINGDELRAKVVGEGGNLGFSQLGRIEYALSGGRINTDFIDNSAGVDCSDNEVNIKIALGGAVSKKKIDINERNDILAKMTNDVVDQVLENNFDQNIAITIMQLSDNFNTEYFSHLAKDLEKTGLLDCEVEFLPNKSELSRRAVSGDGMTRPELSVLLSYSKMSLDLDLSETKFTDEEYFNKYLMNYFPPLMREQFKEEILSHPLRHEIIRTKITNKIINQLGGPTISSIKLETGAKSCDIVRAYAVICEIFNLDELWNQVTGLNSKLHGKIKVEMLSDLGKIMRRGISWFVKNMKSPINISTAIKEFSKESEDLSKIITNLLVGPTKIGYYHRLERFEKAGVSKKLAESIATLEVLVSAFDIIFIAKATNNTTEDIANLYFETGEVLGIDWLRKSAEAQIDNSYWNRLSLQALKDDFYDKQRRLIIKMLQQSKKKVDIESWLRNNKDRAYIFTEFLSDIRSNEEITLNMIILANKKLETFLRNLRIET